MVLKLARIVVLTLVVSGVKLLPLSASPSDETQLKAVFVLNFAKLTEWPTGGTVDGNTFTIAVLGKAPSATFNKLLKGQTVHGRAVTVKQIDNVRQVKESQLLYLSDVERQRLPGILKEVGQQSVLTVSDMTGFCEAGGMIGLVPVQNRLGFEVNLAAVRKARLSVSSQLLKLAKAIFGN